MTYRKVNYADVEPVSDAMHFLSEPLGCQQVGVTISRCRPGWRSKPHDHADDGHEEIYVLMRGTATVRIDDEYVSVEDGDAIWIAPEATRQIQNGDTESAFVLVSAPEFHSNGNGDADDAWSLTGFHG
ncbi:cupin domain-containing protein [Halocatena salina]|uniref:Cupin domain-containing protein n=1 Tax=Halocatena salina TaxID=2934340 RepID=A0A8U0A6C3_9EURY|nr:cupin domain-containing protein [Halocatena salina]UPM44721.1 cupin domain-containing protein [Halocatena salina]